MTPMLEAGTPVLMRDSTSWMQILASVGLKKRFAFLTSWENGRRGSVLMKETLVEGSRRSRSQQWRRRWAETDGTGDAGEG